MDQPNLQPLVREISWTIICRSKNKTVVEYALRNAVRPIGVATYTVVPELPEAYRDELPSAEAIAERLRLWDGNAGEE